LTSTYFYVILLVMVLWVLILPMRNGNIIQSPQSFASLYVLILPMRNGNLISYQFSPSIFAFLSYLWGMETFDVFLHIPFLPSSYPTYEEWKQFNFFASSWRIYMFLSYLWGMETFLYNTHFLLRLLFLSYLWGMETQYSSFFFISHFLLLVLILPMRNGNVLLTKSPAIFYIKFLSYLWGMETCNISHKIL